MLYYQNASIILHYLSHITILYIVKINYISIIGLLAGTLTTLSFLPQVVKAARTKQTKDLSLSMYIVLATGIFLWTIYGILIEALPVILANGISFILAAIVLILKIKYG